MDYPNDAFHNQDIIKSLSTEELRQLSNLKELRRSALSMVNYFEEQEGKIFNEARNRIPQTTSD